MASSSATAVRAVATSHPPSSKQQAPRWDWSLNNQEWSMTQTPGGLLPERLVTSRAALRRLAAPCWGWRTSLPPGNDCAEGSGQGA